MLEFGEWGPVAHCADDDNEDHQKMVDASSTQDGTNHAGELVSAG